MNPLAQAIADFETAQTNLSNADGANIVASMKLDAAKTSADTAAQADRDAVTAYNEKIDAAGSRATESEASSGHEFRNMNKFVGVLRVMPLSRRIAGCAEARQQFKIYSLR